MDDSLLTEDEVGSVWSTAVVDGAAADWDVLAVPSAAKSAALEEGEDDGSDMAAAVAVVAVVAEEVDELDIGGQSGLVWTVSGEPSDDNSAINRGCGAVAVRAAAAGRRERRK